MNEIGGISTKCPYCNKDLSVYNIQGARKHIERCSRQKYPTYTYRESSERP